MFEYVSDLSDSSFILIFDATVNSAKNATLWNSILMLINYCDNNIAVIYASVHSDFSQPNSLTGLISHVVPSKKGWGRFTIEVTVKIYSQARIDSLRCYPPNVSI